MLPLHALELLAPARDADTGIAAIDHGADAVYIGGPSFGARQAAGNSLDDIARLCDYAHRWNARVFLTLNTLFRDNEIEAARSLAFDAKKAGVDVLIVQDMGLLEGPLPDLELHASTQCDIRTPEKAAFLEKVGFSQLVLARESDLERIRAVRAALTHARIEFFIHGALCVSYSGQCYMSEAMLGRSANRGACAQLCRLPYDVSTEAGDLLARRSHVLSLKDNAQGPNLEALIDAGVSSFKIEGRLKDIPYVKNITALYRKKIDEILARRPKFRRSSDGETVFHFAPDASKTFRRGETDYFVHGQDFSKLYDLAQLESPKNTGDPVARILRVDAKRLLVDALPGVTLANGDGLTYEAADEEIHGLYVNRAEREGRHWALYPRERTSQLDGLQTGTILSRNRNQAFEKILAGKTAERRIPISATFAVEEDALTLLLTDGRSTGFAEVAMDLDEPSNPEENKARLAANLSKMGDTIYRIDDLHIPEDLSVFVPASVANQLRRHATAELDADRARNRESFHRGPVDETARYPEESVDYRANVANRFAKQFYERRGARVTAPAFEILPVPNADLMTCRHCVRAQLRLCPKMLKHFPEWLETRDRKFFRPEPLLLKNSAGEVFRAEFHCKADPCFMTIVSPSGLPQRRPRPEDSVEKNPEKSSEKSRDKKFDKAPRRGSRGESRNEFRSEGRRNGRDTNRSRPRTGTGDTRGSSVRRSERSARSGGTGSGRRSR